MQLLTISEACQRLRISRATLYKLVKRGTLPLVKVGGKSLITEEALQNLLRPQPPGQGGENQAWELYYEELRRLGLTTPESRQAIVAPTFGDFVPIDVTGKPASDLIIEERGER
ncbi:MAG: helix-turn-helix domain-containing protein [Candidatus Methylomirabilia bacterium]